MRLTRAKSCRATKLKWLYVGLFVISIVEWVVATKLRWIYSVAYVSHLSQLALTGMLIEPWQGARTEEKQS